MGIQRWVAGLLGLSVILAPACSNDAEGAVEAQLRADLEADGLGEESVDCLVDAARDAGIDLERLDTADPPSPTDALALSHCLEDLFEDMFAGLAEELPAAFSELEAGDLTFDTGGFGDPDALAGLQQRCGAGDNGACDDLWLISPIDSPEETFAASCGGRSDEPRLATCEVALG